MEKLKFNPQLDKLQHQWRNFPMLKDSVGKMKGILANPDNKDLSSVSVYYKLDPGEWKGWPMDTFFRVYFHLSDPSLQKSDQFWQTTTVMQSMVDESGNFIPPVDKFQIVTKAGIFGTTLEPGSFLKVPDYVKTKAKKGIRETEIISQLSQDPVPEEPWRIELTNSSGEKRRLPKKN